MRNKLSPIIIVILIAVLIAIGLFVYILVNSKGNGINFLGNSEEKVIRPVIQLSLNSTEENQEKVTIDVSATTEDEAGVASITLPDGTVLETSETTYDVTENGDYTFSATGVNGQTSMKIITVSNIRIISAKNPYMPEGFTHVGGEVDSGFTIEDKAGNQYVWVPVESGKLSRKTVLDTNYQETSNTSSALVNSVAQNYGFYMARFEASQQDVNGEQVAASMGGKMPWNGLTYQEAANLANDSGVKYGYEGYSTAIINSYAWDTTLEWIDSEVENYSSNTSYGNYSGTILPTGATEADIVKNICDLAGNLREWTSEIFKTSEDTSSKSNKKDKNQENVLHRVVRGGSANLSRTAASHTGWPEDSSDNYWGFRMILFKN